MRFRHKESLWQLVGMSLFLSLSSKEEQWRIITGWLWNKIVSISFQDCVNYCHLMYLYSTRICLLSPCHILRFIFEVAPYERCSCRCSAFNVYLLLQAHLYTYFQLENILFLIYINNIPKILYETAFFSRTIFSSLSLAPIVKN